MRVCVVLEKKTMYFVDLFATHMCIGVAQKDFSLKPEGAQQRQKHDDVLRFRLDVRTNSK